MITIIKRNSQNGAVTLRGLAIDTKPTSTFDSIIIANGSEYECIDTGERFLYDAESSTWKQVTDAVVSLGVTSFNGETGSVVANVTASGDGIVTIGFIQNGDE